MVSDVLRERISIDQSLSLKEIQQKYALPASTAYRARQRGYFCKNYNQPQVKINPDNFNSELVIGMARKMFWKKYRDDPTARKLMDDLIQEGCLNAWIKSGYYKPSKKYSLNYHLTWAISNGMTAFYTAWLKTHRYQQTAYEHVQSQSHRWNGRIMSNFSNTVSV